MDHRGLLAIAFFGAGVAKPTQPKEKLHERMAWVEDFSPGTIKMIGVLEILAAIGLILPAALDIVPVLVPLAARPVCSHHGRSSVDRAAQIP